MKHTLTPFLLGRCLGDPVDEEVCESITTQPGRQEECPAPHLPSSESDQFLTTPDDTEEKDISPDGMELKHRAPKKDLLEIDRFTICGNRID